MGKTLKSKKVPIKEIIRGLMTYSSNTNTDYMINMLGEKNINETKEELLGKEHSKIRTINSILSLPIYLQDSKHYDYKKIGEFIEKQNENKLRILFEKSEKYIYENKSLQKIRYINPGENIQKIWSELLPEASSHSYSMI